jgi:hypothetical protein
MDFAIAPQLVASGKMCLNVNALQNSWVRESSMNIMIQGKMYMYYDK